MKKIQDYELIIFDCDGVLLNSNAIKSNAFKYACSNFGEFFSNQFKFMHFSALFQIFNISCGVISANESTSNFSQGFDFANWTKIWEIREN